jgi:tellurite resistance protein TerC
MIAWLYVAFVLFVIAALAVDLLVASRRGHVINLYEALAWSGFWITLGLGFTFFVYHAYESNLLGVGVSTGLKGRQAALQYLTGYLIEESLSVDNMVVFAMIFSFFQVPHVYQHRVLFWGILGAIIMRGIMIAAGTVLINRFAWVTYLFGAILLISAGKLLVSQGHHPEPERSPLVKLARWFYPVTDGFRDARFFAVEDGRRKMTPLFLVLLTVEGSDLLFAVDSIPAVLAVTTDPFLVFTSNIFAVLGLRSVYFALSGLIQKFKYLQASLIVLLGFVGVKMLLVHHVKIPTAISLLTILTILLVGIAASVLPWKETVWYVVSNAGGFAQMSLRQARRIVILIVGMSVVLVGVAMLVLPGPAMVVIPLGLAILATEFVWARRILKRVKDHAMTVVNTVSGGAAKGKKDDETGEK